MIIVNKLRWQTNINHIKGRGSMDAMGIIAFSVAFPLSGIALAFAIISLGKVEKLEKKIKELEEKIIEN